MKPVSLADITYEQGLQLLFLRKQAMETQRIRRMTPEALSNTFLLRDIGQSLQKSALDADVRNLLLSGALGTGLGAAAGLGRTAMKDDDDDSKNYWSGALRGGLAGGAMGGGLGLALNPSVANKLYDLGGSLGLTPSPGGGTGGGAGRGVGGSGSATVDPNTRQSWANTSSSSAPEATLALTTGGSWATAAELARRNRNAVTPDITALSRQLQDHAKSVVGKKGNPKPFDPHQESAYGELLTGTANNSTMSEVAGRPQRLPSNTPITRAYTAKEIEQALKAQGRTAPWYSRMFGVGNTMKHNALPLASQALGETEEEVLKRIGRSGIRDAAGHIRYGKLTVPIMLGLAALAATGLGANKYQKDVDVRRQALDSFNKIPVAPGGPPKP